MKIIIFLLLLLLNKINAIYIKETKDCSEKITRLTQFEFGTNGYLLFKLLDNDLRELSLSTITICKNNNEWHHEDCEIMQKDCISKDLYNLYQQNIPIEMNITESGHYEISILHCSRNTNIHLSYFIHMKNDIYELSIRDIKEYKSNYLLFYILLLSLIIQIIMIIFTWKQVTWIQWIMLLSTITLLTSNSFSLIAFSRVR